MRYTPTALASLGSPDLFLCTQSNLTLFKAKASQKFHPGLILFGIYKCYNFLSSEAISSASDRNFQKITNNFGKVLTNERKLQADMHKVANMMKTQMSAEQEIEKKLLSSRISAHFQTMREIYIDSLQSLLSSIELPSEFLLIRNLVSNRDSCLNVLVFH